MWWAMWAVGSESGAGGADAGRLDVPSGIKRGSVKDVAVREHELEFEPIVHQQGRGGGRRGVVCKRVGGGWCGGAGEGRRRWLWGSRR